MKNSLKFKIIGFSLALVFLTFCEKSNEGYLEIRNQSPYMLYDVTWGNILDFGDIDPGKEKGIETESVGEEYLNLRFNGKNYRSENKITVDARSSATFIVKDTSNLELVSK